MLLVRGGPVDAYRLGAQGRGEEISLSPAGRMPANWATQFSPTQLTPLTLNMLRALLLKVVDFDRLRRRSPFKLFIGTTQANTVRLRVFRESELTVDVLLASACLPRIHPLWMSPDRRTGDDGYSANPAIFPLFYECEVPDVLLVLLSALGREDTPQTPDRDPRAHHGRWASMPISCARCSCSPGPWPLPVCRSCTKDGSNAGCRPCSFT